MHFFEKIIISGLLVFHIAAQILILPYSNELEEDALEAKLKNSHSATTFANKSFIENLLTSLKSETTPKKELLTREASFLQNKTVGKSNKANSNQTQKFQNQNEGSLKIFNFSRLHQSKADNFQHLHQPKSTKSTRSKVHELKNENVRFVQERGVKKNFLENAISNQPLIEEISSTDSRRGILTDDIIKQKVARAKNILKLRNMQHTSSAMIQLHNLDSMSIPIKLEAEDSSTKDSIEKNESKDEVPKQNETINNDVAKTVPTYELTSSTLVPPLSTTPAPLIVKTTAQPALINFISQDYGNVLVSSPKNITEIIPQGEAELNDPSIRLVDILQKDVLSAWVYKDYIKSPADLMLDQGLINRAKISVSTGKRLRHIFEKALLGKEIHVALITSAVTRAFASDPASQKWLYPNALIDWWQKTITPSTNSSMLYKDVSLTGVGRDYFSRCLKSHLPDNGDTNLVLWELSGSDYKPHGKIKPLDAISLERLLRNTLSFRSHPDLIILNFFRGNNMNHSAYCKELDEESETRLANHYDCTALSWSKSVCPYLTDDEEGFSFSYLFSRDKIHPSIIGHAQMAYILIDYIRDEFLSFLRDPKPVTKSFPLPTAIFTQVFRPLCFTTLKTINAVINGDSNDLPVIFISPDSKDEAIHRSQISNFSNAIMPTIMRFTIPDGPPEDSYRTIGMLASFSKPLKTVARLDDRPFVPLQIKDSEKIIEIKPAVHLSKGAHMLRVWSLDKNFKILALTLDSIHKSECSNEDDAGNDSGCW